MGCRIIRMWRLLALLATAAPAAAGPMQAARVFPRLSFTHSVFLADPMDGTGRLFHVNKEGVISVFPNVSDPAPGDVQTFLDISARIVTAGEQGLLGLAFDPDFASNGGFYVYYSASPPRSVISRFTAPNPVSGPADPDSEVIIIQAGQPPLLNHKAGMVSFGPDGMLYIALGDGGNPDNSQFSPNLLGKILRIDVRGAPDPGLNYRIPPDNPFVSNPPEPASRREIWASGLRNPYRFSFDRQTGALYCADVGRNSWEEVDIIAKGGNYGWPAWEGNHPYLANEDDETTYTFPLLEYSHEDGGASVTGGYVYYGNAVPDLYGEYIFGDFITGKIFGLRHEGERLTSFQTLVATAFNPTGFGQDASGEVYFLDFNGGIYVLRPDTPTRAAPSWPRYESGILE